MQKYLNMATLKLSVLYYFTPDKEPNICTHRTPSYYVIIFRSHKLSENGTVFSPPCNLQHHYWNTLSRLVRYIIFATPGIERTQAERNVRSLHKATVGIQPAWLTWQLVNAVLESLIADVFSPQFIIETCTFLVRRILISCGLVSHHSFLAWRRWFHTTPM